MIVNLGKISALAAFLAAKTSSWIGLIGAAFDEDDPTLTYTDLSIIIFGGASDFGLGGMPTPTMDGTRAKSQRASAGTITNDSGMTVTIYGWYWAESGEPPNLLGVRALSEPLSLPTGETISITPIIYSDNLTL